MVFQDEAILDIILKPMASLEDAVSKEQLLCHIQSAPKCTVIRMNTHFPKNDVKSTLEKELEKQYLKKSLPCPDLYIHPIMDDTLIITNKHETQISATYPKVVVGLQCGLAVLRGSHVYAAGLMGVPSGLKQGCKVSVFADLQGLCKRGLNQEFTGPAAFVGNGILVQNRASLFGPSTPSGLAVEIFESKFDCPSMGDILENTAVDGVQLGFLQNLPSILCGHVLDPQTGELILDMCAAPGGKTTHIAALLGRTGTVVALDRSATKVRQIEENAKKLGLQNVRAFVMDAVRSCRGTMLREGDNLEEMLSSPPFPCEFFDRVLLDAPCSGVGQRPQLYNTMKSKEFLSFPKLQKKLLATAYELLKDGGRIVYSTCSYSILENEEIVSWALQKFPKLRLVSSGRKIGDSGFKVEGLTPEICELMQRFGTPVLKQSKLDEASDTIGFFLCCFVKDSTSTLQ